MITIGLIFDEPQKGAGAKNATAKKPQKGAGAKNADPNDNDDGTPKK